MVSPRFKSVASALFLSLWVVTPALALHETDHRYDITGYVLGADEKPVSGVRVVAHMENKPVGSGRSDATGYYRFRLHLHDADVGRELRIKTPESQGTVRVTLTPGDKSSERIHHVNFIGGKLVEGELAGRGGVSMAAMIAAAVGMVLVGGIFAARHFRRVRRRRMRSEQKAAKGQGAGGSKRRKRGKRRR
jgi:hypothetical protein